MKGRKGVVRRIAPDLDMEICNMQTSFEKRGIRMRYTDASDLVAKKIRRDKIGRK